jgi:hypothetical protein
VIDWIWVGNFNWLLQQDLREFFCYRQHDDTTAPEFFEELLQSADKHPNAVAIYCDCQMTGRRNDIEMRPSIEGEPLDRIFQLLEHLTAAPARGLIRSAAIRQAGLVRPDKFRAYFQIFGWLAKLLRVGNFRRVPRAVYYKRDELDNYTNKWITWSEDRKRATWTTWFTGLFEAALPLCRTSQERMLVAQVIFDRLIPFRPVREAPPGKAIAECIERLRYEGRFELAEELIPSIEQLGQILETNERSPIRKVVYRVRQRNRMAKLLYPSSLMRRAIYQAWHLLNTFGKAASLAPSWWTRAVGALRTRLLSGRSSGDTAV